MTLSGSPSRSGSAPKPCSRPAVTRDARLPAASGSQTYKQAVHMLRVWAKQGSKRDSRVAIITAQIAIAARAPFPGARQALEIGLRSLSTAKSTGENQ